MKILIYDKEDTKENKIANILEYKFKDKFEIKCVYDLNSFHENYFNFNFDISIIDLENSEKIDFNKLCKEAKTKVIVMVSIANEQIAEKAIEQGCFAMIHSPVNAEELETTMHALIVATS